MLLHLKYPEFTTKNTHLDLTEKKVFFSKEIHNDDFAMVKLCFSDLNVFYRFGEGV